MFDYSPQTSNKAKGFLSIASGRFGFDSTGCIRKVNLGVWNLVASGEIVANVHFTEFAWNKSSDMYSKGNGVFQVFTILFRALISDEAVCVIRTSSGKRVR